MGKKVWRTHSLKPQALWAFKATCVALGEPAATFAGQFDTDELKARLVGNPVRLKVIKKANPNDPERMVNEITSIRAPSGSW